MKPLWQVERALELADAGLNAYLLGLYLGDGMISRQRRAEYRLRVFLDRRYPVIIAECEAAMSLVLRPSKVGAYHHPAAQMVEVNSRISHPRRTYTYPRYFFSNRSPDIQRIFCEGCDRLGVAWRRNGPWSISVARREAVAALDRHVGPKR